MLSTCSISSLGILPSSSVVDFKVALNLKVVPFGIWDENHRQLNPYITQSKFNNFSIIH